MLQLELFPEYFSEGVEVVFAGRMHLSIMLSWYRNGAGLINDKHVGVFKNNLHRRRGHWRLVAVDFVRYKVRVFNQIRLGNG